jgi:hypothetical protein
MYTTHGNYISVLRIDMRQLGHLRCSPLRVIDAAQFAVPDLYVTALSIDALRISACRKAILDWEQIWLENPRMNLAYRALQPPQQGSPRTSWQGLQSFPGQSSARPSDFLLNTLSQGNTMPDIASKTATSAGQVNSCPPSYSLEPRQVEKPSPSSLRIRRPASGLTGNPEDHS